MVSFEIVESFLAGVIQKALCTWSHVNEIYKVENIFLYGTIEGIFQGEGRILGRFLILLANI